MNRSEAMEKALKLCISEMCEQCREAAGAEAKRHKMPHHVVCVNECETLRIAKEALALPRRNCDVGTADEKYARFREHCMKCDGCMSYNHPKLLDEVCLCALRWAQMPYAAKEGGAK